MWERAQGRGDFFPSSVADSPLTPQTHASQGHMGSALWLAHDLHRAAYVPKLGPSRELGATHSRLPIEKKLTWAFPALPPRGWA